MRLVFSFAAALFLASCVEAPNDAGVGRTDSTDEVLVISDETVETAATDGSETEETTAQIEVVINTDNPDISDTQDFAALSERETIESDAARLAAQKEKFTVIAPTALPSRTTTSGGVVVRYALETTHNVGDVKYKRFSLSTALSKRACNQFRNADEAQLAFLKAGGPKRDSKNLDPDGDGFACDWSPVAYRSVLQ